MIIGIVGSEAAKFTKENEEKARVVIRELLVGATKACSGHCHLGGIDIWVEEEADKLGIEKLIFPPANRGWNEGYKQRNLQIAYASNIVYCITIAELPPTYSGMKFSHCYHCAKHPEGCKEPHVKSGGCWTALQCDRRGWRIIK